LHEFSITQSILSIALEKANTVNASRVSKINLVIGELSGVVDECVQFYFDFLSKDTLAAQANLSFQHRPIQLRCRNCANIFSPDSLDWTCPNCQAQTTEIVSGRECYVESIEVE
jgi:hydrogenase nickel incorporation protein HypA/HybF